MDKMIITQTFTMARWQIVVKTSEATRQTKTKMTTKTNKQTNKTTSKTTTTTTTKREEGGGVKKQITNRMV